MNLLLYNCNFTLSSNKQCTIIIKRELVDSPNQPTAVCEVHYYCHPLKLSEQKEKPSEILQQTE